MKWLVVIDTQNDAWVHAEDDDLATPIEAESAEEAIRKFVAGEQLSGYITTRVYCAPWDQTTMVEFGGSKQNPDGSRTAQVLRSENLDLLDVVPWE